MVELKGLEDVRKAMRALPKEVGDKAAKRALRAAAKVIEDEVRANAQGVNDPKTRESIAANVTTRFSTKYFKRTGDPMFRVGIMGGAKGGDEDSDVRKGNPGGFTWYWRLVEFGRSGVPAHPFMRPAMLKGGEAITAFNTEMRRALDAALKRLVKKGKA